MPARKKKVKIPSKKFAIYGTVAGGKYLGTIEAINADEAKEIAWAGEKVDLDVGFCHQCSSECEIFYAEITDIIVEEEE